MSYRMHHQVVEGGGGDTHVIKGPDPTCLAAKDCPILLEIRQLVLHVKRQSKVYRNLNTTLATNVYEILKEQLLLAEEYFNLSY